MSVLFHQVDLRLARAHKHLAELRSLVARLEYTTSKIITLHHDLYGEPVYFRDEGFETLGNVESSELQVVIDDIAHNFRAALNYLVVALARINTLKQAVPKSLQFPIDDEPDVFLKHRPRYLDGVSAEHVAMIERVQPYNRCDWTRLLRDLSNKGKHVELVRATYEGRSFGPSSEDEAELLNSDSSEMDVQVDVSVEIALANWGPLMDTLEELETQTSDFVEQFEPTINLPKNLVRNGINRPCLNPAN
jgi:hypothetical protein